MMQVYFYNLLMFTLKLKNKKIIARKLHRQLMKSTFVLLFLTKKKIVIKSSCKNKYITQFI